jgi:hypothetical protein
LDFVSFPLVVILFILLLVGNLDLILSIDDVVVDIGEKIPDKNMRKMKI